MKKVGVSPLIASMLIIAFTIMLATLVIKFSTNILEGSIESSTKSKEELKCNSVDLKIDYVCQSGNIVNYKFSNTGNEEISKVAVRLYGKDNDVSQFGLGLKIFSSKEFTDTISQKVEKLEKVEVIPITNEGASCNAVSYDNIKECNDSRGIVGNYSYEGIENSEKILFDNAKRRKTMVNISNAFSCYNQVSYVSDEEPSVKDFDLISKPFKINCSRNEFSFSIPYDTSHVKVIKCNDGLCSEVISRRVYDIECPVDILLNTDKLNIYINGSFKKSDNILAPPKDAGWLSDLFNISGDFVELSVPVVNDTNIIEGIYAKTSSDKWIPIEGIRRNNTIKASIDLRKLLGTDSSVIGVAGVFCPSCFKDRLTRVYNPKPDTREAIVLVHGILASPNKFNKFIDDFRLTNQPYQVWIYSYPTGRSINVTAKIFANEINAVNSQFDDVHFIGHSMGGLVTREALSYAYNEKFNFIDKVRQVIIIGTPNLGSPVATLMKNIINENIGDSLEGEYLTFNPEAHKQLIFGLNSQPVPGVMYYSIAGTKTFSLGGIELTDKYFNSKPNDGLVSVESATDLGNIKLRDKCKNFWSMNLNHGDLVKDKSVIELTERIISRYAMEYSSKPIVGYSNYYKVNRIECNPEDVYFIFGRKTSIYSQKFECSCGNQICDGIENSKSCLQDCAPKEKNILIYILILFIFISVFVAIIIFYINKRKVSNN